MAAPEAPYDRNGNLLDYAEYGDVDWRPNTPFRATLTYDTFTRGQSSAKLVWVDAEGHRYPMFLSGLDAILRSGEPIIAGGLGFPMRITATWIVVKRGQNYGIAVA